MIVTEPTLVLHVEDGHDGPDGGGEQRSQPAHQEVDPVVCAGIGEENIDHQDIVEVQTLNYYFINLSRQSFLRNFIKCICLLSLFSVLSTLIIVYSHLQKHPVKHSSSAVLQQNPR